MEGLWLEGLERSGLRVLSSVGGCDVPTTHHYYHYYHNWTQSPILEGEQRVGRAPTTTPPLLLLPGASPIFTTPPPLLYCY